MGCNKYQQNVGRPISNEHHHPVCTNYCRLEQFSSGAVFCQMLDAYFKDAIPMNKVCCWLVEHALDYHVVEQQQRSRSHAKVTVRKL